ncbi:MAG: hypothetical protein GX265_05120 [Mollicutes bacterium]|nr:hypothetical protein [Mollicutes bacterium]
MDNDILFDSVEEKEATERVLATVRVKTLSQELDQLISEIIKLSSKIDSILEENNFNPRYLEKLGVLENLAPIYLDEDLKDIDFRVKEVIEDYIKRINTRVNLIKNNEILIDELKEKYAIDEEKIVEDINKAKLNIKDFLEQ